MSYERFAPAKVNLFLHVGPLREDGYHPLCSLMTFANVGDRVRHFSIQADIQDGEIKLALFRDDQAVLQLRSDSGHYMAELDHHVLEHRCEEPLVLDNEYSLLSGA